jgi:hypothetical protein
MTYFFLDATNELFQAAGCLSCGACIYQLKIARPLKVRLYHIDFSESSRQQHAFSSTIHGNALYL